MTVCADHSLNRILRSDPAARERLLSLIGRDSVLADLIARDTVPARLRVGEAARMAGISQDSLLAVLAGTACPAAAAPQPAAAPPPSRPASPCPAPAGRNDWFALAEESGAVTLDARPILASGRDPFADVMRAATEVPPDGFLLLDAPFDPAPLRRVLAGQGFTSVGRQAGPGHWRICFRKMGGGTMAPPVANAPGAVWREGGVVHIDVRGLAPPGPLTAVLRLVEAGEATTIMVHHDRDPAALQPALEAHGWECFARQKHGDEIRLLLRPRAQ